MAEGGDRTAAQLSELSTKYSEAQVRACSALLCARSASAAVRDRARALCVRAGCGARDNGISAEE